MEPKISEKAWEPVLEEKILKKWQDTGINDFVIQDSIPLKEFEAKWMSTEH